MNENKNLDKGFPLTESILLATVPFLGYLVVFAFEFGFANYFQIPIEFISVSLTSLLLASLLLIFCVALAFFIGHGVSVVFTFIFEPLLPAVIRRAFKRIFIFALIGFIPSLLCWGREWKEHLFALGMLLSIVAMEFGWPLLTQRKHRSYISKMEAQEALEISVEPQVRRFFNWADSSFGKRTVTAFLLIFFLLLNVQTCGFARAKKREKFLMFTDSPPKIALRMYGDTIISVGLDEPKREIDGRFEIVKLSESGGRQLSFVSIGRLTVKK